jgi:4'-phosphopantetheinyl transferase
MTSFEVALVPGARPVALTVETAFPGEPPASLLAPLSAPERSAARDMPRWRRAQFVQGRVLLRLLVADVLRVRPAEVALEVVPAGGLRLREGGAGVSVSHTGGHVAAAAWPDGSVGVDVQDPPAFPDRRLERRCCGVHAVALGRLPDRERTAALARTWSVQEACVKATGAGLRGAPWRIPVPPGQSSGCWGEVRWVALDRVWPTGLAVAGLPRPGGQAR